jgi:parallel beta-helix repeat protein
MKRVFGLFALVWAFSLCSSAQTTSCTQAAPGFYVSPTGNDSNSGSACSPWRTLQHAANTAGAGATVHVLPGTYTEDLLTFNKTGTATARIRFISDRKWGALIRSHSSYTVLRMNGSYVDLIGFDLAGDSNSCLGIADWGSNNRVISNHVHNIPARAAVCGSNGGAGIDHANYTASNDDTIGNMVHDIGSWPTEDDRTHGIYHSNSGGSVWNNIVYRCAGFGIDLSHSPNHGVVSNNTVFNNVYGGIYIAEDSGGTQMRVMNNIVVHNKGWGIVEPNGSIPSNAGNVYLDNLTYDNPGYGNIFVQPGSIVSGNIVADPQFVNYTGSSDGNYSLRSTSPARDQGTINYSPLYDFNGGPRPVNLRWDIGAYEYGAAPAAWPWFPGSTSTTIAVTISPTAAALQFGGTQQFTAAVSGTTNVGVKWSVNGVSGGNSTTGTITASGLYTAPASVPPGVSVTVTATSVANSAYSAKASVSFGTPTGGISVAISPTSVSLAGGSTKQFSAAVSGTTNTSLIWQVNGVQGGSTATGTISTAGLYTAPVCPAANTVTVTARSYYDTAAFANASVALTAGTTAAGYYVSPTGSDSNNGSACHPWQTLQHAANVAGAGATVHVAPGTYTQNLLTLNNSGTATARIRFISDQKWGAKIRSNSSYTVMRLNGSYLDIVGFDVAGDAGSCLGIANWGSNTRIISNHVHNIPAPPPVCGSNGGAGIDNANYSGGNDDTIGNVVHDIGQWPAEDDRTHGIYHSNSGGHILNNITYRCAGTGLDLSHFPDHVIVANNTVFNNVYVGIYVSEDSGGTGIIVVNNVVAHNKGWGIVEPSGETPSNSGNKYINNITFDNPGYGNIHVNPGSTIVGNIVADPLFVNYTGGADGNYALQSTSPARDHGTSSYAPAYDINGGFRPVNSLWDIGAYEYGSAPATWPWM